MIGVVEQEIKSAQEKVNQLNELLEKDANNISERKAHMWRDAISKLNKDLAFSKQLDPNGEQYKMTTARMITNFYTRIKMSERF
jgi:hypothetical protein